MNNAPSADAMAAIVLFIRNNFSDFSNEEISLAFEYGLAGKITVDLNHYHDFNVLYVSRFLNAFREYRRGQLLIARKAEEEKALPEKAELTVKEKEQIMIDAALKAFEIVKSGQLYDDIGNSVYNFLDEKKLIPFTKERKMEFLEEAEKKVKAMYEAEKYMKIDLRVINVLNKLIDEINCKSPNVIVEAKKIALNELFKQMIELDEKLELK